MTLKGLNANSDFKLLRNLTFNYFITFNISKCVFNTLEKQAAHSIYF